MIQNEITEALLRANQPQKGKFITGYNLLTPNIHTWTERMLKAIIEERKIDPKDLFTFFEDFLENVHAEVVEDNFPEDWEIEYPMPRSVYMKKDTHIAEQYTYFMLLPLDYNRPGMNDICVCWMTTEGRVRYSSYITGDY